MKLQRYNLGELTKHYASDKDNVVCREYDVDKLEASHAELLEAAKDVVERWESPMWKWDENTGYLIACLRAAIAKAERASE